MGDVTQLASPDTGTAGQTFDAAGNLKTRTDSRGVLATHTYDALNRMTSVVYSKSGSTSVSYTLGYDQVGAGFSNGRGRLTSSTFPGGSTRYAHDPRGRVLTATQTVGVTQTTAYAYDQVGRVTRLTYPSGRVLTIAYTQGLMSAMSLAKDAASPAQPLISQISHQPFGAPKGWLWHMTTGTVSHERVFDLAGRMVRYPLGALVRDVRYDAADRIVSYTHRDAGSGAAQASFDQTFNLDQVDRLTQVAMTGSAWSMSHDANGNRVSVTLNGATRPYTTQATSNRLQSIGNPSRTFTHDPAGNTLTDSDASAGYTATFGLDNRLATLKRGKTTATYTYNAFGQRVKKVVGNVTTLFVYGPQGELLGEYDGTGRALREFVWLDSIPVAMFVPDANASNPPLVYFIHADHLDTPRVVVDRDNRLRWRWLSEPFGTTAPETNPGGLGAITFPLRSPGQYADAESGLIYNWWRYYDSTLGRYTQFDPTGLAGDSFAGYDYVNGDPIRYVDPDGLTRGRPAATPQQLEYSAPITSAQINALISRIRQYDPSFNYQTIRPSRGPSSTYSRADVNALTSLLRSLEANQTCSRDGVPVGRFIADQRGNVMLEPVGGSTVPAGVGRDTHTLYPNGSNYMRLNPQGHLGSNPTPHGHGHQMGTGPGKRGQGLSLDPSGNVVPRNSPDAHWPIN